MNTKTVVLLVALGATIAVGGRTIAVKTGHAAKSVYTHVLKKPIHIAVAPVKWAGKRIVK
jgi:hypothetical protein